MTTRVSPFHARSPGLGSALFGVSSETWNDWRWQYAHRLTTPRDLDRIPWLDAREKEEIARVARTYPFAVTPFFLGRIRWADPGDPVRRQVLPTLDELRPWPGCLLDPLAEGRDTPVPGLVHRYPDRVVVLVTGRCAVYCRHCFRKRLWRGGPLDEGEARWEAIVGYLSGHEEIREVLLSGGDPLVLPDGRLEGILARLRRIRHVEVIRIGSRVPVVLPQRITPSLCRVLERFGPLWLVTQFNHAREISPEAASACERLLRAGIPVNSQSVLLRGVNDDPETMTELCRGLLRIRVRPYYLHQCDPVAGAGHFRTSLEKGIEILRAMEGRVSGLAVPKFVVDLPGGGGKVPLQPAYHLSGRQGRHLFRNYAGRPFSYEDPP